MDRKTFAQKLALLGVCPFVAQKLFADNTQTAAKPQDDDINIVKSQKEFIQNWLADLLESMDKNLDRATKEKLVAFCGVQCFNRHQFKKDIAINSNGSLDKLIENYSKNFEIWKEGNNVHIRYGEVSNQCYCPAANYRKPGPNDIHCECTRNTHKAIFESALGRPVRVEVAESLRRGGKTCHFVVFDA
jgi:hypothetical protein